MTTTTRQLGVFDSGKYATSGSVRASGILRAALEDVEQGHLATIQQLATADIFLDFLEQADHLLSHGYSAPAASLAGAVLENGLRSLAERNDIAVKARDDLSALNSKIVPKGGYNRLRQAVAVWVDVEEPRPNHRPFSMTFGRVTLNYQGRARFFLRAD